MRGGGMRGGGLTAAALALVASLATTVGAETRGACAAACNRLVNECTSTCDAYGELAAACRRAVLRRCRREGVAVCEASPTSTVPTSTTRPPTTSATTTTRTTTTHTTTTAVAGLDCGSPRTLPLGADAADTSVGYDHGPGVGCMQNSESPDLVYRFVAPSDGTLTVTLSSEWDGGVYVQTTCGDPDTEIACVDRQGGNADEVLELPVTAGQTYWLWVDGYASDQYGSFSLTTSLQ